ncbi:hypothetical protein GCM10020369_25290 [Cryptosporangium minutisporangium]|uniref:Uncharacterized protein n=1 Tax=Cryptosporangium minutisporangium TaxID=113569 RepID=A0ABP6SXP2_9ACTN
MGEYDLGAGRDHLGDRCGGAADGRDLVLGTGTAVGRGHRVPTESDHDPHQASVGTIPSLDMVNTRPKKLHLSADAQMSVRIVPRPRATGRRARQFFGKTTSPGALRGGLPENRD